MENIRCMDGAAFETNVIMMTEYQTLIVIMAIICFS